MGTLGGFIGIWILLLVAMAMGVGVGPYVDPQSIMIVVVGSIAALFVSFDASDMKKMGGVFGSSFKGTGIDINELIKKLVDYATQARRDGILSLEQAANNEEDAFLKTGLSMAIDGGEPDTIKALLTIDLKAMQGRHEGMQNVFSEWGGIAGAFGMIGTLIGLVAMLLNMADPAAIGPAMAVALLTTLYGSMIGNIFGNPIASRLSNKTAEEVLSRTMIIEGIMSIQSGDNPRTLEAKLLAYLPPADRISQFE